MFSYVQIYTFFGILVNQDNMNKRYAVIVAGGSGTRMKSLLPKQFLELCGQPVIMHTIERFHNFDKNLNIILVLPSDQFNLWKNLCLHHLFSLKHTIVAGGNTRYQSVKNGLQMISGSGVVAIHDGVRPLVSNETLLRCFNTALETGNAIPVIPIHETVRQINADKSKSIDRNSLKIVQTPQVFSVDLIKKAYNSPCIESFTDDASVAETMGIHINMVDGNRENIKITEPSDLLIAELLLRNIH